MATATKTEAIAEMDSLTIQEEIGTVEQQLADLHQELQVIPEHIRNAGREGLADDIFRLRQRDSEIRLRIPGLEVRLARLRISEAEQRIVDVEAQVGPAAAENHVKQEAFNKTKEERDRAYGVLSGLEYQRSEAHRQLEERKRQLDEKIRQAEQSAMGGRRG
jgi:chromosome segregation ATPase